MYEWVKRRIVANIVILPAVVANYLFLYVAGRFQIRSFGGFSIIIMGDLIALGINNLLVDWNIKQVQRYKSKVAP